MSLYWYRTVFLKTESYKLNPKLSDTWDISNFKKKATSNLHYDQRIIE